MTLVRLEWLADAQLVPFYLMASFLYYHREISLFSDRDYDLLCKRLKSRWNSLPHHRHKRIIDRSALSAGTGYYIRVEEYPYITQSAALQLARYCGID